MTNTTEDATLHPSSQGSDANVTRTGLLLLFSQILCHFLTLVLFLLHLGAVSLGHARLAHS